MLHILRLDVELYSRIWSHLLPEGTMREQVAFLFCRTEVTDDKVVFEVIDKAFLGESDFVAQSTNYLELTDETHTDLIKRAHALGTSLVELHSHRGPCPAAFSLSDRRGLRETIPHMRWRLKQRPYLAIVVAPSDYDALVWPQGAEIPEPLGGIEVDGRLIPPTNNSIEGWDDV